MECYSFGEWSRILLLLTSMLIMYIWIVLLSLMILVGVNCLESLIFGKMK